MSETIADKIRRNWVVNSEERFGNTSLARVNHAIDEAMRRDYIQKGDNRREVEVAFLEAFKVKLDGRTKRK